MTNSLGSCRKKCQPEGWSSFMLWVLPLILTFVEVLRCTNPKLPMKNGLPRACHLAWCDRDLVRRYSVNAKAVRENHFPQGNAQSSHAADSLYDFTCPCCQDECQTSICGSCGGSWVATDCRTGRRKKGLETLGLVSRSSLPTVETLKRSVVKAIKTGSGKPRAQPVSASTVPSKRDSSSFAVLDGDSSLSDVESDDPVDTLSPKTLEVVGRSDRKTPAETSFEPKLVITRTAKPKTLKPAQKTARTGGMVKPNRSDKVGKLKGTEGAKGKQAKRTEKEGAERPRPRKPEVVVEPPEFEKVDTQLDCEAAMQRIQVS